MNFKKINVTLKGNTPLLMNKCTPERLVKKQTLGKKKYTPEEDAAKSTYLAEIDGRMQLYVPALNVYTMMVQTCGRKTIPNPDGGKDVNAKGVVAGAMRIKPDLIPLGTDQYEIDIRPAVVQRARIPRARAMITDWRLSFDIIYDSEVVLEPNVFREILEEAGFRVGLLDYRPQHMGPFGTFSVESFEVGV